MHAAVDTVRAVVAVLTRDSSLPLPSQEGGKAVPRTGVV